MYEFKAQMERVFKALNISTQADLARVLDINQPNIYQAKKAGKFPQKWLFVMLESHGINPLWVMTGNGPMFLRDKAGNYVLDYGDVDLNAKPIKIHTQTFKEKAREILLPESIVGEGTAMEVESNAMHPIVSKGDIVIMDKKGEGVQPDGVYLVTDGHGTVNFATYVSGNSDKMIFKITMDGHTTTFDTEEVDNFVIGKASCIIKKM